ncbi:MAG: tRNA (N6-threonylcarbamoyladenosine(37)-N6)-methyltransferase TrmO [Anaerolineae bacterium]|nr:tRNA (N6-threonylcarbamoyladenosine(37)-N6)-methyltransferase TrmO [Anaerolineae bacterium]
MSQGSRAVEIHYRAIGTIHSPFSGIEGMPIQPPGAAGVPGCVEVDPEWVEGLRDLDGFSHVILLYHFHQAGECRLTVTPFLDAVPHGVFATRAPRRPNPIGLSVVRLLSVEGSTLHVEGIDVLDGTPLLDVKPYVPEFDHPLVERLGWLEAGRGQVGDQRADGRFR